MTTCTWYFGSIAYPRTTCHSSSVEGIAASKTLRCVKIQVKSNDAINLVVFCNAIKISLFWQQLLPRVRTVFLAGKSPIRHLDDNGNKPRPICVRPKRITIMPLQVVAGDNTWGRHRWSCTMRGGVVNLLVSCCKHIFQINRKCAFLEKYFATVAEYAQYSTLEYLGPFLWDCPLLDKCHTYASVDTNSVDALA